MTRLLKIFSIAALSLSVLAGGVLAAEEGAITCQLHGRNARGWVPAFVAVITNDKGQVTVSDPIILHFNEVPVAGRIVVDNSKRITYAWTLEGASDATRQYAPAMDYRLTVQKADRTASITVVPRNYANTLHGKGKCAPLKRK